MALGAVLGGLGGQLLEAGINAYSQHKTNKSNESIAQEATAASARQAQDQMAFQEKMSNTSYQRAMEDMRSAGLNPILAYSQGGATTPSGAQGTVQSAKLNPVSVSGLGAASAGAVQNYMQLRRDDSQISLQDQQKFNTQASTQNTLAETEKKKVETFNAIQAQKRAAQVHNDAASARKLQKMESDWDTEYLKYNKTNEMIQKGSSTVEGVGDAIYSLVPGGKFFKNIFGHGASSAKDASSLGRFKKFGSPTFKNKRSTDSKNPKHDPYTGEF